MHTGNSVVINDPIIYRELSASLVYHPFKAQVSQDVIATIADALATARVSRKSYDEDLDEVTQILLKSKDVASTHTGDEVAAIAHGMVQRIHEITAFSQLISSSRFFC
jgi:hypothetical protein